MSTRHRNDRAVAAPAARPTRPGRDRYVDFLRAASLLVVVGWHWVFSIVTWHPDPGTTNPIATTTGLWAFTWVLQVMPLFFFVGGFAHLMTWQSVERAGGGYRLFLVPRLKRLLVPAGICLAVVAVIWGLLSLGPFPVPHLDATVILILSPLWFLAIYVGLVLLAPALIRFHRAAGVRAPVALAGAAILVDGLRFHGHVAHVEWLNMVLVWGFAHQLGFFWPPMVGASKRLAWLLVASGAAGLLALTNLGSYPRSMVGVPGEAYSNMGPPTVCILALALVQVGVVLLLRARVTSWLERPLPGRFTRWAGARSMTVYLWHFPAFAAAYALVTVTGVSIPQRASAAWWRQRPVWVIVPAGMTFVLLRTFRRFEHR